MNTLGYGKDMLARSSGMIHRFERCAYLCETL